MPSRTMVIGGFMSLLCAETWDYIEFGGTLMSATRENADHRYALDGKTLDRIPADEKRPVPCQPGDGGINIHLASSTPNGPFLPQYYSLCGYETGEFAFSISRETAERCLPNVLKNLDDEEEGRVV